LNAGAAPPEDARLDANAPAQALSAALSGDALETVGASAAIATAARAILRLRMVLLLIVENTNAPHHRLDCNRSIDKRVNFTGSVIFLIYGAWRTIMLPVRNETEAICRSSLVQHWVSYARTMGALNRAPKRHGTRHSQLRHEPIPEQRAHYPPSLR
jgi:hypothetical protein